MASIAPDTAAFPATRTSMRRASRRRNPCALPAGRLRPVALLGPTGAMIWVIAAAYFASPAIGFVFAALVITTLAALVAKMCAGPSERRGARL